MGEMTTQASSDSCKYLLGPRSLILSHTFFRPRISPPHLTSVLSRRFLALLYVNSAGGDDTEIPQSRDESFFSIDGDHYLPISPPRFLTWLSSLHMRRSNFHTLKPFNSVNARGCEKLLRQIANDFYSKMHRSYSAAPKLLRQASAQIATRNL